MGSMQRLFVSVFLALAATSCSDSLDEVRIYDHSVSMPVDTHGVNGVYQLPNFARVEVRDTGAKVTVRRFNANGDALHVPYVSLTIELTIGKVHTVSDKTTGNGEVTFDGKAIPGNYFVLGSSGRFEAIEAPTPGLLEMVLDSIDGE